MAEFLTGTDLSAKIRDLLSGTNLRCAVAFWGDGAAKLLCTCSAENSKDAKIVCDLSMGGTYPPELKKLGAPHNNKLRFLNGLHAKVYISDAGLLLRRQMRLPTGLLSPMRVDLGMSRRARSIPKTTANGTK
jgi:hypothetical protein